MKNILIVLAVCTGLSANAQVEFKTEISKDAVMIGEPFKLDFSVNKNFDNFSLKENQNFKIISGPNTSMQQSINMVNGKVEKKITVKYTYFFKAEKPGKFKTPLAEIKIQGKSYYSEAKEIIVIDSEYHNPNQTDEKDIEGTSKL